jgi:FkbM family methyltransferase
MELEKTNFNFIEGTKINYYENDNCIGKFIKSGNVWELFMRQYIENFYEEGTNMIDIGANIGTISLLHMKKVLSKGCKIFAFEPIFYNILKKNVEENNFLEDINVYSVAIADKNMTVDLPTINPDDKFNYGGCKIGNEINNNNNFNCYKLDHFNFKNVSLIKIDVEGYELEALNGMIDTIKNNNYPTILIEIWSFSDGIVKKYIESKSEKGVDIMYKYLNTNKILSNLGYIGYFIQTDDFIFVHKSKINKLSSFLEKKI